MIKPNIQLLAEPAPNGNDGGKQPEPKPNEPNDGAKEGESTLEAYLKEQGLTADEMKQAVSAFKAQKGSKTPDSDTAALQNSLNTERQGRLAAEVNNAAMLEALKQGADLNSLAHVLKLAELKDCADKDGKLNAEKLTAAIKAVLDDVPAFKQSVTGKSGVNKVGGDGGSEGGNEADNNVLRRAFGLRPKK